MKRLEQILESLLHVYKTLYNEQLMNQHVYMHLQILSTLIFLIN